MCGIAGIVGRDAGVVNLERLKKMTDSIAHRGPDGEGHWVSSQGTTALGNRRLAILDLTEAGRQPMQDVSGRYTIVYNGEIYNYVELRNLLERHRYSFRSTGDTEVLLAMYHWKQEKCLPYLDGMFAFAIHDGMDGSLFCARDRFGEKPFYYCYEPGSYFLFGSEMKALWAASIPRTIDDAMLYNYLAFGLVENPLEKSRTFFKGISRLENSHYLRLDGIRLEVVKTRYWDIDLTPGKKTVEDEVLGSFRELILESVGRRMRSDVPVGSSLSGGLDSSVLVSAASAWSKARGRGFKTFSARFPGFKKDEGTQMAAVVAKTGVEPVYVFPSGEHLLLKIAEVYHFQEEPFGSASILAQYEVMRAAGESGVPVLLDGQGADEILGGYSHYFPAYIHGLAMAQKLAAIMDYVKTQRQAAPVNPGLIRMLGRVLSTDFPILTRQWKKARISVRQAVNPLFDEDFYEANNNWSHLPSGSLDERMKDLNHSLYFDTYISGLSELLRYADRNAMAHSREVRLPYLDHRLVSFLFSLPDTYKVKNGWTKYLLRKAFEQDLPLEIVWRKDKVGYEPPQQQWMTGRHIREAIFHSMEVLVQKGIFQRRKRYTEPPRNAWPVLMAACLFG